MFLSCCSKLVKVHQQQQPVLESAGWNSSNEKWVSFVVNNGAQFTRKKTLDKRPLKKKQGSHRAIYPLSRGRRRQIKLFAIQTQSISSAALSLFPIDPIGPKWTKKVLIPFLDREIVNSHLRLQYGRTKGKKGGSKLKGAWGGRQLFGSYDVHQISMSSHGQFQQKLFNVVLTWKDRRALGWCFPWDLRNHEFKWSAQLKANAYQTQWIIWPLQKKCFFASLIPICAQKVLR